MSRKKASIQRRVPGYDVVLADVVTLLAQLRKHRLRN